MLCALCASASDSPVPDRGTLRKGTIGDYRNYVKRADARLIDRTQGALLRELGYVNGPNWVDSL